MYLLHVCLSFRLQHVTRICAQRYKMYQESLEIGLYRVMLLIRNIKTIANITLHYHIPKYSHFPLTWEDIP